MEKDTIAQVGSGIRTRRLALGLTLADVSDRSKGGISLPHLSSIERGEGNPTLQSLAAIASCLETPLSALFAAELASGISLAGTAVYTLDQAKDVIAGYAFGTDVVAPRAGPSRYRSYGTRPKPAQVPLWAYRSYDCVQPSDGPDASDMDLFVAAGLNSRVDVQLLSRLQIFAPGAFAELAKIDRAQTFWDVPPAHLVRPPQGSVGWHLFAAWRKLGSVPGVSEGLIHKVLHHKRPKLFPLVDDSTLDVLSGASRGRGKGGSWWQIHHDLTQEGNADFFGDLETWFGEEADRRDGAALSRLRLHDILLWCRITPGQAEHAAYYGRRALSRGRQHPLA